MEITDLISRDRIITHLKVKSKKQLLQELAHIATEAASVSERRIFDTLVARERLGSTGMGRGIAIPHGKIAGLERLFGVFVSLEEPIEFDSVDEMPVDLVFLLLAPEATAADHLKALARISRRLRDPRICDQLRHAGNPETAYDLLTAPLPVTVE